MDVPEREQAGGEQPTVARVPVVQSPELVGVAPREDQRQSEVAVGLQRLDVLQGSRRPLRHRDQRLLAASVPVGQRDLVPPLERLRAVVQFGRDDTDQNEYRNRPQRQLDDR
jgi:hypothetical protein